MSQTHLGLPQELIDMVVEHVSSDISTLTSIALAHRAFSHPSRSHLFRTIHLHNIRRCIKFSALLDLSPQLSTFVRHLSLVVHGPNWPYGHEKVVIGILTKLTRLRCIAVTDSKSTGVDFGQLPPSILAALLESFSRRGLKGIMLTINRIPIRGFLEKYPAIQDITLVDTPLEDIDNLFLRAPPYGEDADLVAQNKHTLHTLRLARASSAMLEGFVSSRVLQNEHCAVDITTLKRLALSYGGFGDNHGSLNTLLREATSLEQLSLQPVESALLLSEFNNSPQSPIVRDPIFLSHCPSLRTVHIFLMYEIRLHVGQPDGPMLRLRPHRWLTHLLSSVDPDNNNIETIKISFRFPFWYGRDELRLDPNRQSLQIIDRTIAEAKMPRLQRVVIAICAVFNPPEETPFKDTMAHIAEAMPQLNAKGMLDVVESHARMSPIKFF